MFVKTYTNDVIGPDTPMTVPVADGDRITFLTALGFWSPMITPTLLASES
jgi:hypothetical protein